MVKKRVLDPIPVLDEALLSAALREEGIKELHAASVWHYALSEGKLHGSDATFDGFEDGKFYMSAPAPTGPLLRRKFAVLTSTVVETQRSEDGTVKLLVRLQDGQMVETVIIKHNGTHPRTTLCVSSQVGCQMACTFCATGTMGLKGDLTAGEILEQVLHASRVSPIRNVVFMGMGEPLNNYDAVLASIRGMADSRMFKLSPRHITLSTVGVVPRMKQLTIDAPETQLALSLHAPNQELRNRIVPSARAYRLDKLMDALDGHLRGPGVAPPPTTSHSAGEAAAQSVPVENGGGQSEDKGGGGEGMAADGGAAAAASDEAGGVETIAGVVMVGGRGAGRRALIEYVMLAGVNDTEECGRELGELLKGRNVLVNLIPYNPTYAPGSEEFKEPTEEALQKFRAIVHEHGLLVTIRRHHGRDIDGACGQLAVKVVTAGAKSGDGCSSGGGGGNSGGDIEDLVAGASKRANGNLSRTGRKGLRGTAGERSPSSSSRRNLFDAAFPDGGGRRLAALSLLVVGSTAVALVVAARARRRG
ncbi:conserved unknown protein [Ectocarpus siliculosus]|uniref:Radical SAM core domain-containing protein n=1 Tax=Ectocarpus siliculosus TaxID=2880 RepID=D7FLU3_ECTSI|nr:conserved unknown protein [Ectocarpus siliculosus]|eukprot:CBJ29779.1 conserved unknown protein [Ectocarpus siliculosus]